MWSTAVLQDRNEDRRAAEPPTPGRETDATRGLSLTRLVTFLEESGGYQMNIGQTGESIGGTPVYRVQLDLPLVLDGEDSERN